MEIPTLVMLQMPLRCLWKVRVTKKYPFLDWTQGFKQAFLDFYGLDFDNFQFTPVYISIYFPPL